MVTTSWVDAVAGTVTGCAQVTVVAACCIGIATNACLEHVGFWGMVYVVLDWASMWYCNITEHLLSIFLDL